MMKTIIISNDPSIARDAQEAGISRIMVDLEIMGKKERQASRKTFITTHTKDDIAPMRDVLTRTELIVRVNPWFEGSPDEIDDAIAQGADIIMMPMITSMAHFEAFTKHVAGRAKVMPLVETSYSMAHIADIANDRYVSEVYIGLNDLHLSLGLDFLFEPLALGLIDWMASQIRASGKQFGFGGMATLRSGELPAERVLAEHVRLGSSCVILSSRFCHDIKIEEKQGRIDRIEAALADIQKEHHRYAQRSASEQHNDYKETAQRIRALASKLRDRSSF